MGTQTGIAEGLPAPQQQHLTCIICTNIDREFSENIRKRWKLEKVSFRKLWQTLPLGGPPLIYVLLFLYMWGRWWWQNMQAHNINQGQCHPLHVWCALVVHLAFFSTIVELFWSQDLLPLLSLKVIKTSIQCGNLLIMFAFSSQITFLNVNTHLTVIQRKRTALWSTVLLWVFHL